MIRIHRIGLIVLVLVAVLFGALARPAVADDVETRIAAFWTRVNTLQPTDYLSANDVGQWALNLIGREPRARLTVADFRVVSGEIQAAMDRAGLAPTGIALPTAAPTPVPTPVPALTIVSSTGSVDVLNFYEVVGEVRNNTAMTARFVTVTATFYDASGAVIDTATSFVHPSDIPAGATAPFKIIGTKAAATVRYKLVASTN